MDCDGAPGNHDLDCDDHCPLMRGTVPHLHLVCVEEQVWRAGRRRRNDMRWLNGYVEEPPGLLRCIWREGRDTVTVVGHAAGTQLPLELRWQESPTQ